MKGLFVFSILLASALAAPQQYGPPPPPPPSNGGYSNGGGNGGFGNGGGNGGFGNGGGNGGYGGGSAGPSCGEGEVVNVDGNCARLEVSRNVYVYTAPEQDVPYLPPPEVPAPKVEVDIVFVKTPEALDDADPIVVPPPQKKTLVYVLSKKQEQEGQQVIEIPTGPKEKPEVYYVNYNDGENPALPGGISLQDALNAAAQTGQEIDGAANGGGGGGFGGGNGGGYGAPAPAPPSPTYG